MISPIALKAEQLYPLPNIGTNVYESTQIGTDNYDQGGARLDHYFNGGKDQLFARYSGSGRHDFDPLPISGAGVPGFPVTDEIVTNSFTISDVHSVSAQTVETLRAAFFRNALSNGHAANHTPGSSLGFTYQPTLGLNQGVPYLIVSGYASLGNPITGPQNTWQNDYQGSYSIAMTRGTHNLKVGAELDRQQINVLFGIATNGFFVFAPFPVSDSFGSFLLGQSVQFFQGGGRRRTGSTTTGAVAGSSTQTAIEIARTDFSFECYAATMQQARRFPPARPFRRPWPSALAACMGVALARANRRARIRRFSRPASQARSSVAVYLRRVSFNDSSALRRLRPRTSRRARPRGPGDAAQHAQRQQPRDKKWQAVGFWNCVHVAAVAENKVI